MADANLRVLSFAGKDAVLANPHPDRFYSMESSPLYWQLREEMIALRPKLFVIDTVADVFAGNEIARSQTRQFITMLRALAIANNCAVVIAAHPSLEGIKSDSGLSGSTGWHNSVRARMYLKAAPGEDTSLRALEFRKNNYGPVSESIVLRWQNGVYVVEGVGAGPSAEQVLSRLAEEEKIDELFLTLLRRYAKQGRNVSDKASSTYAPAQFAREPDAKRSKVTKDALADSMTRLFSRDRLVAVPEGPPSRQRSRIVEVEGKPTYAATSNTPSNAGSQNLGVGRWKANNPITTDTSEPSTLRPMPFRIPKKRASEANRGLMQQRWALLPLPTTLPTTFQRPSRGCVRTPPIPPLPVGRGQGGVGRPRPLPTGTGCAGGRRREAERPCCRKKTVYEDAQSCASIRSSTLAQ
jgi:AAA domain